jgi:hypothetical protein
MRRVSYFAPGVAALLLLLSALVPISPAMGQDPAFDELEAKRNDLILLFDRREFDQLDSRLNAIQHRYESGELSDMDLGDYFDWVTTFGAIHPEEYDSRLTAWVVQKPGSYAAHLARGMFYVKRGFDARGVKYAADTSASQFRKMRAWFARGRQDLEASLGMTAKPLLSHVSLQEIALATSSPREREDLFNQAMAYAPRSYLVRSTYMRSLLPRWGGSYEKMEQFARESEAIYGPGDEASGLWNMIAADRAGKLIENEQYAQARAIASEALARRESTYLLCLRASANGSLSKLEEALADLQASLNNTGESSYCASVVSWIASFRSEDPRVEPILNAYILRNPGDGELYLQRAYERGSRNDGPGAVADLEIAHRLGNVEAAVFLGRLLINGWEGIPKDQDRGLALLREAADGGDSQSKLALSWAVKELGLESEEQDRHRGRKEAMKRMRGVKTTWDIQSAKSSWGVGRLTDHRVIASVLAALVMMGWLRRDRQRG